MILIIFLMIRKINPKKKLKLTVKMKVLGILIIFLIKTKFKKLRLKIKMTILEILIIFLTNMRIKRRIKKLKIKNLKNLKNQRKK